MGYDFLSVIQAINEVEANIWMGDLKIALNSAESCLEKTSRQDLANFQRTATVAKDLVKRTRKEAKEKTGIDIKKWVAEQVSKKLKQKGINMVENHYGVLLNRLSDLREAVAYLIKKKTQTTLLNNDKERPEKTFSVFRVEGYRYSLQRTPEKWEVRALLDKTPSYNATKRITVEMKDYGLSLEEIYHEKSSRTFELYSEKMYVQVICQENQSKMYFYTPISTDSEARVKKIAEKLLNILAR